MFPTACAAFQCSVLPLLPDEGPDLEPVTQRQWNTPWGEEDPPFHVPS